MDQLKKVLMGREDSELQGVCEQLDQATTLSMSNRITGFVICLVAGFSLTILGLSLIPIIGLKKFVVLYTLGNILSIGSTLFLMGPWKQLQRMFNSERWVATLLYFVLMALTILAVHREKTFHAIVFCILQFLAMIWYSVSYIPFAHRMLKSSFSSCI